MNEESDPQSKDALFLQIEEHASANPKKVESKVWEIFKGLPGFPSNIHFKAIADVILLFIDERRAIEKVRTDAINFGNSAISYAENVTSLTAELAKMRDLEDSFSRKGKKPKANRNEIIHDCLTKLHMEKEKVFQFLLENHTDLVMVGKGDDRRRIGEASMWTKYGDWLKARNQRE